MSIYSRNCRDKEVSEKGLRRNNQGVRKQEKQECGMQEVE